MPCDLYFSICAFNSAREEAMQERCGAASKPAARISSTVSSVPSRVEPPAPNVQEKNLGFSCPSCCHVARSFSFPCAVFGGKNSKLNVRECFFCDCISRDAGRVRRAGQNPLILQPRRYTLLLREFISPPTTPNA